MRFAFYRAHTKDGTGKVYLWDRLIAWWTKSPYSHAEVILDDYQLNGILTATCASSSSRDGGVRIKTIDIDPNRWDIVECDGDHNAVIRWFSVREGLGYDYLGLVGFVIRPATEGENTKFFCSEAIASALGIQDPWAFSPGQLYDVLAFRSRRVL